MRKITITLALCVCAIISASAEEYRTVIAPLEGECWWGGIVNKGYVQPYFNFNRSDSKLSFAKDQSRSDQAAPFNLSDQCCGGATMPLLLSSKGRYVWSDRPFKYEFTDGVLILYSKYEKISVVSAGSTLKEAYKDACAKHFPFDGREPAELMFTKPQFNNWIESAIFGITQENAEKYVDDLAKSGFPCGVLMIDGGWQRYHGRRDFNPDTFPAPNRLTDKIHGYGYKSVFWVSYFISGDARPEYREWQPSQKNLLVRSKTNPKEAALVYWWNGISVTMDLTRDDIRQQFIDILKECQEKYGIDGFKFDGGNPEYFRGNAIFSEPWMEPVDFSHAYNLVGESFPYHEFRSGFKTGGHPIIQRLHDVGHSWFELKTIIPNCAIAGLVGYPYTFADMIGGGLAGSFRPGAQFSHKLFIRSCQAQALMPMMQFSVAPWRVLTEEECAICKKFAELHVQFGPYIMEQVHLAAKTGEPIMRTMEYEFPGKGYEKVNQQFMLGPKYLVAPVVDEDDSKVIELPAGKWKDDLGKIHKGPVRLELKNVPLDRLPYFEKL